MHNRPIAGPAGRDAHLWLAPDGSALAMAWLRPAFGKQIV